MRLPEYDGSTLADLSASLLAGFGAGGEDRLGVSGQSRYVVLLVDGLGRQQLLDHRLDAPSLARWAARRGPLTCGVPSTTATSLSSLGTALPPGEHGIVGYSFRGPTGSCMNALTWDGGPEPGQVYGGTTVFERLRIAGVTTTNVSLARFKRSGLTRATLRGAENFEPVVDEGNLERRIDQIVTGALRGDRSFVYAYERKLDHVGHGLGVASGQWRHALRVMERFVTELRNALPSDVCLIVTGDHGMIDVPSWHRLMLEDYPDLMADIDLFAGEGRLRQLYSRRPDAVARRWSEVLGERAWVISRDEGIDAGMFGSVSNAVRPRIGDVLVLMRSDWAVMSNSAPHELSLVGMHGSVTAAEMEVPFIVAEGCTS